MTRHINWITPFFNYQSYDRYDDHGIHH
jgi:hypothetical protein